MLATSSSGGKHILIVEDETAMAKALQLKLNREGFEATIAENGRAGLEALRTGGFDAMLLDIMMPEVDGWEMMETMQREGLSLPILITSNLSQSEDLQRAEALGASKFLVKSNQTLADIAAEVHSLFAA